MATLYTKDGKVYLQIGGKAYPIGADASADAATIKKKLEITYIRIEGRLGDKQKDEVLALLKRAPDSLKSMAASKAAARAEAPAKKPVAGGAVPRKTVKPAVPKPAAAVKPPATIEEAQRRLLEAVRRTQGKKRAEDARAMLEALSGRKLPAVEAERREKTPAPGNSVTLITRGGEVFLAVPGRGPYPLKVPSSAEAEKIREALRSLYIQIEKRLSYRHRLEVDALIRRPADELKRIATAASASQRAVAAPPAKPVRIDEAIIRRALSRNPEAVLANAILALAANRAALERYLSNPKTRERVSNLMFDGIRKAIKAKDAEEARGLSFDSELLPSIPPKDAMRLKIDSIESLDRLSPEGQALVTRTFLLRFMVRSNADLRKEVLSMGVVPINADPLDAQTLLAAALYLRRWNARASKTPPEALDMKVREAVAAPATQKGGVPKVVGPAKPAIKPSAEEEWMVKLIGNCANAPKDEKLLPAYQKLALQSITDLYESDKLPKYLRGGEERAGTAHGRAGVVLFNMALDAEKQLPPAFSFSDCLRDLVKRQPADFTALRDYLEKNKGKLDEGAGAVLLSVARLALRSYFLYAGTLSSSLRIEMESLGEMGRPNRLPLGTAEALRLAMLLRRASLLNNNVQDFRIERWEPPRKAGKKPEEDDEFKIKWRP